MLFQFKISIKGITKPPVWRKVVVPAGYSFLRLHNVIQAAFGWYDCHLFDFVDREYDPSFRIAVPDPFDDGYDCETLDASEMWDAKAFDIEEVNLSLKEA